MTIESDTRLAADLLQSAANPAAGSGDLVRYRAIQDFIGRLESGKAVVVPAEALRVIEAARELLAYNSRLMVESHLNGCTDTADGSLECICDDPHHMARKALAAFDAATKVS